VAQYFAQRVLCLTPKMENHNKLLMLTLDTTPHHSHSLLEAAKLFEAAARLVAFVNPETGKISGVDLAKR